MPGIRAALLVGVMVGAGWPVGCTRPNGSSTGMDAGQRVPHFVEIRANTFTYNRQTEPSVDVGPDGNLLIAWGSRRQEHGTYGVFAQRFDVLGERLGPELHVNQTERSMQLDPAVVYDATGNAWIVWESDFQDGERGAIVARRFGQTDTGDFGPLSDEMLVNQTTAGHQSRPSVAATDSGDVLIVWLSDHSGRVQTMGRVFRSNGESVSGEFAVGEAAVGRESAPAIAGLNDGHFVVVWARTNADNHPENVYGRLIASDGTPLGAEWVVNDIDGGMHIEPAVDGADDGRFVVTWLVREQESYAVVYRIFDANGHAACPVEIAASGRQWRSGATVAVAPDGRFAIAFNVDTPEQEAAEGPVRPSHRSTAAEIRARRFAPDGAPLGERFRVNRFNEGRQALTIAASGRQAIWTGRDQLAFVWTGNTGQGDKRGVAFSLFGVQALERWAWRRGIRLENRVVIR